jgi:ATP-dependent exoDNAse (exonuclease V) beta subunit
VTTAPPPDAGIRREVLDPARSFIVRAPAGSGKTELLVRRFLGLLAVVDEPEEILAITFTRKAAGEMRRRVLAVLQEAAAGRLAAGEAATLAAAALARDAARGWQLLAHPARLRIGTIDGLNSSLAAASPVSAGGSGLRRVCQRPLELYREAAIEALQLVAGDDHLARAAGTLLEHLDNRLPRAADLLAAMLARRDQWLPLLGAGPGAAGQDALRERLEAGLRALVEHRLALLEASLPGAERQAFTALSEFAADQRGVDVLHPAGDALDARRAWWAAAATTWLTKDGGWRQRLDVRGGFPAGEKAAKQKAQELLARLGPAEDFREQLAAATRLPPPRYPDAQWQALAALMALLPAAAAALRVQFAARGMTDFVALAEEALRALGASDEPGLAAERFDARLRHVLIDEFQDTSRTQHRLLDALTAGFVPGDGRTVFLVGDPMQSIYRFREAEVGLFMALAMDGSARLDLVPRTLAANFRSAPAVVEWVNGVFARLLPALDDPDAGAVAFAPAIATRSAAGGDGVTLHAPVDAVAEAAAVVRLVREALELYPEDDVGILVRSRPHAAPILAALEAAGIAATAVDLRRLGETTLAHDLLALARALVNPADRLAWLAVLRAPWCGLTLADLEALAGVDADAAIPDLLASPACRARLSAEGQAAVTRVLEAFARVAARNGELDLRDRVEGLWIELGGPACAGDELALVDDLLALLDEADTGGDCIDPLALAQLLREQAVPGRAGSRVEVLTIHKAKGLEFDTVIVPGLGRTVRREDRPPLLWRELRGGAGLLLAPVNAAGTEGDPLYELLWDLDRRQARAELDRLLYVACTRARRRLHLLGTPESGGPARESLLARLWDAVPGGWPAPAVDGAAPEPAPPAAWLQPPLRRLPAGWSRPAPPPALAVAPPAPRPPAPGVEFAWASDLARRVGVVVHRLLQLVAVEGSEGWDDRRVARLAPLARQLLVSGGVGPADLGAASARVLDAIASTLADPDGRWLLSARHPAASTEYAVTWWDGAHFRRLVMDRTFLTTDGERWVIDYKTGRHEGGDLAGFLASEAGRYAGQLQAYRSAWSALGGEPVRVALYFPLLPRLHEVP